MNPNLVGYPERQAPWKAKEKHFADVYTRYYRQVYGICRRYSSRPDDAVDLTHEVFIRYFQNFEHFRQEASPSTWMYRVAVNLGIVKWRKEKTRNRFEKDLESVHADTQDNETALLNRIALKKILDQYPDSMRRILVLHHYERLTQVEIGRKLRISRSTVARNLLHFKRTCRRQVKV